MQATLKLLAHALVVLVLSACGLGDGGDRPGPTSACVAPPVCPPRQVARGCRCETPALVDLTSIPANPDQLRAAHATGRRLLLAGDRGLLVFSPNGGASFGVIDTGSADPFIGIDADDHRLLLTSAAAHRLTLSDDSGLSFWRSAEGPADLGPCRLDPAGGALCTTSSSGSVLRYDPAEDGFKTVVAIPGASGPTIVRPARELTLVLIPQAEGTLVLRSADGRRFTPGPTLPTQVTDLWLADDASLVLAAGARVYRSSDGGQVFSEVLEIALPPGYYRNVFSGTFLAATTGGPAYLACGYLLSSRVNLSPRALMFASSDGGLTWSTRADHALARQLRAMALVGDGGVILAGDMALTSDGGDTLAPAQHQSFDLLGSDLGNAVRRRETLSHLTFPTRERGFGVVTRPGYFSKTTFRTVRTADEGRTLVALPLPGNDFARTGLAVVDATHLVAARGDQLYLSDDGGESFRAAATLDGDALALAFTDARRGLVLSAPQSVVQRIHQTGDGGATLRTTELPAGELFTALALRGDTAVLAGQDGGVLVSQDGGERFAVGRVGTAGDALATAALAAGVAWVGGSDASGGALLLRSLDGGSRWEALPGPLGLGAIQRILAPGPAEVLVLSAATLYRSHDGGTSWTLLWTAEAATQEAAIDVTLRDDTIYLSSTLGLFRVGP